MRKIRILEHISLDGVIQSPGSPEEDPGGGFDRGGWVKPHHDPLIGQTVRDAHGAPFDLLLGRHTYDIWSSYWPHQENNPMAGGLNAAVKHVATHRPESLAWGPAKALGTDIVEGIRALMRTKGPDLITWGSSTLTPVLLEHRLADELLLFVYPVLLGSGKRLFAGNVPPRGLAHVETRTTPSGVLISTYRPAEDFRTGSVG